MGSCCSPRHRARRLVRCQHATAMVWPPMHWLTFSLVALGTIAAATPAFADPAKPSVRELPGLALTEVEQKLPVPTRIPMTVAVELDWAQAELSQRIPQLLHQGSNRQVAPGIWIDDTVTRGAIDFRIRNDGVTGHVPIELQLDVRSKIGGMTLPLGHCRSTIDGELDLPIKLASDGKLQRPSVKANPREPCRLSGFDVTPLLAREIGQRLAAAEDQISAHMLQASAVVHQIHEELYRRLSNATVGCHRFVPAKLLQAPLVLEQGVVVSRFMFEGGLASNCGATTVPSMLVEEATAPTGFDLAWSTRLGLGELNVAIAEHLRLRGVVGEVKRIRAVHRDDVDQLALYIQAQKANGWVFARPIIAANALALGSVTSQQPDLLDAMKTALETLSLPIDTMGAETLAHQVVLASNEATQAFGNAPELKLRYETREAELRTTIEVMLERDGLVVTVHRR